MRKPLFGPVSFYRQALGIAVPVMAQVLIQNLVSLIDNFMVAGLGDVSMASVNVANQITFVYIVVVNTICGAGGIYVAQFMGARDEWGMKQAYRFKILFFFAVSSLFFALFWLIPDKLIAIMTAGNAAQADIIEKGVKYLHIISWTLLPMAVSAGIGSSFREIGMPKIPLCIAVGATLVNTCGNYLLIYGNFGAPRLEVEGAAIATVAARFVELAASLIYVNYALKRKRRLSPKAEDMVPGLSPVPFYVPFRHIFEVNRALVVTILRKSGMIFVSEMSWISTETLMTALFNGRGGAEVIAGMSAGWAIANIFFLVFNGIWTTASVLVGGSLGAGKLDEARERARYLITGATVFGAAMGAAGFLIQSPIVSAVYANLTPEARAIASGIIMVVALYLPLWSILNALFAITRAGGDAFSGMASDLVVNTVLFIPLAFFLAWRTQLSPVVMLAILKTTDFAKIALMRHLYRKERWVKNLT